MLMYLVENISSEHYPAGTQFVVEKRMSKYKSAFDDCMNKSEKRLFISFEIKLLRKLTERECFKFCKNPKNIGL